MPQIYFKTMVEGLIIIVMLGVCFGALIVSLSNKTGIGCQSLNCKCKDKYGK
tara:strand:- start:295 stop:450 length:156 start_codon:yes stop_codon:yes gene_type:complete